MLCEICKQAQATVHLTEIVNDQMTELHLCEACANQKGAQVESHFGLADLLSELADFSKTQEPEELASKSCPTC
ncbi:MAG: excinuclease ABC subunit B, partial [Candidatus Omnitrophica bacterium]|nr:excinuclease ABC subunit B [Candidatus Omnitrophota bacterium]